MKIYHLDSSINDKGASLTRKYSKMIVDRLIATNQNVTIDYIDLVRENIPFINQNYAEAMFKIEEQRTDEEKMALSFFDDKIKSFVDSDIYVLGIPGYFYNVPALFKNWFEHMFRIGVNINQNWEGLLEDKKMFIVSAWGGPYANTEIERFFEHFIRKSFELFGIRNISFFNIFRDVQTETDNIKNIERAIQDL